WTHPGCADTFELMWLQVRVGHRVIMVGALYHPPKPIYKTSALLDYIESCLDSIATQFPEAVILLAGDLNLLPEEEIVARTCLVSIVDQPTRGVNKLDRIYISEPCYEHIKVVTSAVKSDHKAVIAYSGHRKVVLRKEKQVRMFRRRSPTQHAPLLQHIANMKFCFHDTKDAQGNFDQLYGIMFGLLDKFYPERIITVTSTEPDYVTPAIKAQLRRKNRLMRAGRVDEANALATRIGATIKRRNLVKLQNTDMRTGAKEVWDKLRQLTKGSTNGKLVPPGITADMLNRHYASMSSDPSYQPSKVKVTCHKPQTHITDYEVFYILDHLRPTATGLNHIPSLVPTFNSPCLL